MEQVKWWRPQKRWSGTGQGGGKGAEQAGGGDGGREGVDMVGEVV